jgi:xanthine dehydrogenase accessory factor
MAAATPKADAQAETTDPVCGETFPPSLAVFQSEHAGQTVYFCSKTCKETFDADPLEYPLEETTE